MAFWLPVSQNGYNKGLSALEALKALLYFKKYYCSLIIIGPVRNDIDSPQKRSTPGTLNAGQLANP